MFCCIVLSTVLFEGNKENIHILGVCTWVSCVSRQETDSSFMDSQGEDCHEWGQMKIVINSVTFYKLGRTFLIFFLSVYHLQLILEKHKTKPIQGTYSKK